MGKDKSILELHLPLSWMELSAYELKFVASIMAVAQMSKLEFQSRCLVHFLQIKILSVAADEIACTIKGKLYILKSWQMAELVNRLEFLTSEVTEIKPLPKIAGRKHVHSRLCGTPLKQLLAAENYFQQYIDTQNIKALKGLTLCLYTDGKEFNDNKIAALTEKLRHTPTEELYTVLLWFMGLKDVLAAHFSSYYKKATANENSIQSNKISIREQINTTIRVLTDGDITKTQMVCEAETWIALSELNQKAKEIAQLKSMK